MYIFPPSDPKKEKNQNAERTFQMSARMSGTPQVYFRALLLRHGETDANATGLIQGSSDFSRLTPLGRQQAANVRSAIWPNEPSTATTPDLRPITSIYCSPLTRSRDTLEEVLSVSDSTTQQKRTVDGQPAPIQILQDLREIDFYDWQGGQKKQLECDFPESWEAWKKGGDPKGILVFETNDQGETVEHYPLIELWQRAEQVWKDIWEMEKNKTDAPTVLMVAHGSLGQALLGTAMGWGADQFRQHEFANCGLVEIEWTTESASKLPTERPNASRWRWRWPQPSDTWQFGK